MSIVRPFYPRREIPVGQVIVPVSVVNVLHPAKAMSFGAMVDTGAFGLILPRVWKDQLGPFPDAEAIELEMADQRIVTAEVCGPVRIQMSGFRKVVGEVIFVDMQASGRGYEPLVGYTVLELSGAVVDMVTHRVVARKYFDLKRAAGCCSSAVAP
jgi:predicted aspartyl protease